MLALKKTIENTHAAPDENPTTHNQENGEKEKNLTRETHKHIETILEKTRQPRKTKPKLAASILRDFATQLPYNQEEVIRRIAKRTAVAQDFTISKLRGTHKIVKGNIYNILKNLFNSLEELGLRKIQTTELKRWGHGYCEHYLITKQINDPDENPKKTNKSQIKNGRTQYEKVTKNLDFIPNKFHDVLLFLALSSKYNNWVDYNEIAEGIKKHRDTISAQIRSLKELLPKIGIELLEEKTKRGKKYFHLAEPNKSHDEREKFQEKKQERKNPSSNHVAEIRRLLKIRMISNSAVIKRNWPKRKPIDEWYHDKFEYPPRRSWAYAGDKNEPF